MNRFAKPYAFFQLLLFCGFVLYIATMPVSTALVNIGSSVALVGLVGTLILGRRESLVWHFPLYPFLLLFVCCLVFSCVISLFPDESWRALGSAWHRNFPMILIAAAAMERKNALFILVGVFSFTGFYEGLDGIFQYVSGVDFFDGAPWMSGRLTGSFGTYRVGSLMAFLLCPTLVLPFILPEKWSRLKRWGLSVLLWIPPLFLLFFSKNRTGMLCLGLSVFSLVVMTRGFSWKKALGVVCFFACLMVFWSERFGVKTVLADGRIQELWPFAWEVFKAHPVLGSGLYTYNPAFTSMGMTPLMHTAGIMHPHNIYLQLLAETGVVGLCFFLLFAVSAIVWSARRVHRGLRSGQDRRYWLAAAAFWSVMIGYMGMGLSGHDLLRSWWFGMAMSIFGIAIGACLQKHRQSGDAGRKAEAHKTEAEKNAPRQAANQGRQTA